MSDDTDQRLTTLEMAVTHQEQTIHELSEVITRLEATKADIDPEEEADRRPPHY
jgi:uncharacterized coiled-coil protein SlyX